MPGFHRTVREMSVLQRERGVMLDPGRGQFTDYKGEALTGKLQWGLVLFPQASPLQTLRTPTGAAVANLVAGSMICSRMREKIRCGSAKRTCR